MAESGRRRGVVGRIVACASLISVSFVVPGASAGATPVPGASTSSALPGPLNGIDAVSASDIWAVGSRPNPTDADESIGLAEHWNGTSWREVATPAPSDPLSAGLLDVSAASADDVWAVGTVGLDSFRDKEIVVEHWNGATWSFVPAPNPSANAALFGVEALGPADVWAVGGYSTGGTGLNHALIEHWNGGKWHVASTPSLPPGALADVAATGPDDVWAAGTLGGQNVTLHFDGASWSRVDAPNAGTAPNTLTAVTAIAPDDAWAVGWIDAGQPFAGKTLALHWNGARWSVVPTPNASSGDHLYGVGASSSNDVCALGVFYPDAFTSSMLALHFRGSWSRVTGPARQVVAEDVAALARDDAWAVGSAIVHWNGRGWSMVSPAA